MKSYQKMNNCFGNAKGIVHSIQHYSIHDGPGIRSTVFFKGCPLRCKWCANPTTQVMEPQIVFYKNICLENCFACVPTCPQKAIHEDNSGKVDLNRYICNSCGICTEVCHVRALKIVGNKISVEEIIEDIEKDELFYFNSGGGVTLSGGEPLFQYEFCYNILKACKSLNISTVLDTSGYASPSSFNKISELVDLFYFDIKLVDPSKHNFFVGVENRLIIKNLKFLSKQKIPFVIRYPLIPGINNSIEDISALAKLISSLSFYKDVHILPYHRLGIYKYKALGLKYELEEVHTPNKEEVEKVINLLKKFGINASCQK